MIFTRPQFTQDFLPVHPHRRESKLYPFFLRIISKNISDTDLLESEKQIADISSKLGVMMKNP